MSRQARRRCPRRARPHRFFTGRSPPRFPLPPRTGYLGAVASVLVIEDDPVVARVMLQHLRHAGFDVEWVEDGERGLTKLRYERPDVAVIDMMLPGLDGWAVTETARRERIGTPIIAVSARGVGARQGAHARHRRRRLPREAVRHARAGGARAGGAAAQRRHRRRARRDRSRPRACGSSPTSDARLPRRRARLPRRLGRRRR